MHKADAIEADHYVWSTIRQSMSQHPDVVLLSNASMAPPAGVVTAPLPPDDEDILRFRSIYKPWGIKENWERENFERFFYLRAYMRREVRPPLAPLRICS